MTAIDLETEAAIRRGWREREEMASVKNRIRMDVDYEIERLMAKDRANGIQRNELRFNQYGHDLVHRTNVLRKATKIWQKLAARSLVGYQNQLIR